MDRKQSAAARGRINLKVTVKKRKPTLSTKENFFLRFLITAEYEEEKRPSVHTGEVALEQLLGKSGKDLTAKEKMNKGNYKALQHGEKI